MMNTDWEAKGFIRTSLVDWPGKICCVLFLPNCNFRCPFCHNFQLVQNTAELPNYPIFEIKKILNTKKSWLDGITITGGEPTINPRLTAMIEQLRSMGLKIKLDTNGSRPRILRQLLDAKMVDAVYMDVKAPLNSADYARITDTSVDISAIATSIDIVKSAEIEGVFRTTVIPGLVQEAQLSLIRNQLGKVQRYLVQPFRNEHTLSPEYRYIEEFGLERMDRIRAEFEVNEIYGDYTVSEHSVAS